MDIKVNIEDLKLLLRSFNFDRCEQEDHDAYVRILETINQVEPDYNPYFGNT